MDEKREPTLAEEAGLPDSWHPVDSAPINPAAAIGSPNPMANFFSGPISPTLQHDVNFVNTQLGTYNIAKLPLVPLAASGQPSVGAAVQSGSTTTINNSVNAVAGGPNGAIQFNNGGALAGSSVLSFNNASNIVTIGGSVNVSGSLILTGNISASVFNATTGFQIAGAATAGHYLRGNGTDFVSAVLSGTDVLAGIVGVTYGGTGANLSATGGAHEVLLQSTLGGAVTVGQLSYADISGTPQLPQTIAKVASEWLDSYTASTGLFTQSQPAASDLSNGVTGTGAVVLAGSPALTGTPTVPTATPLTNNTQAASTAYVDAAAAVVSAAAAKPNPSNSVVVEEFIGGSATSQNIGQNGWSLSTIGSTPLITGVQAAYPNFGVCQIATALAATAGQGGGLSLSGESSAAGNLVNNLQGTTGWEIQWIFKLNQTTATRFRAGVDTNATILAGFNGLYVRYDTNATYSDTTFVFESSVGGVKTSINSAIAVDTNWHRVKITSSVVGTAIFTLYDSSGAVQSTKSLAISIITANGLNLTALVGTDTTAQKSAQFDYASFYYPNIAR